MAELRHFEVCRVVIYPASRYRHNTPFWPYARNCLKPARVNGMCLQHSRMTNITETDYRDAFPLQSTDSQDVAAGFEGDYPENSLALSVPLPTSPQSRQRRKRNV